jgi:predicted metal-dependent hydrolase
MIHSKGKIQYGTITIPYNIVKSKRIKTSEIIVESHKVTIRTPLNKSQSDIEGIISEGLLDTKKAKRV